MFDSHAHVLFNQFDSDRDAVIARAREAGLTGWLEVGTDLATSTAAAKFAKQQGVWSSAGVHPSDSAAVQEGDWALIEQLLAEPQVVAVGEVGLDFYRGGTTAQQLPVLQRFVELAVAKNLPVIFHVRDPVKESTDSPGTHAQKSAHEAMIQFLQSLSPQKRPRGVMHTFSGNQDQAQRYLELGMYLSFSGVVTFKNAGAIAEVAATMPLDRMLLETDCPFLAPEPYRGQRNEPAYVKLVAEKIAILRRQDPSEIIKQTDINFHNLFHI